MPGLIKHLPHHKPWMATMLSIATVVVLATCGFGSYLLVRDGSDDVGANPIANNGPEYRNIDDRKADATPLTAADVFPTDTITPADAGVAPYKRIGNPQVEKSCRLAATDAVGTLLVNEVCTQVVRATFMTPDGSFIFTTGVFNLKDASAAKNVRDQLSTAISPTSRLTGYIIESDKRTQVLGIAPTNIAWDVRGHFLLYTVIARADGKAIPSDDAQVKVIVYDVLSVYLRKTVMDRWALASPGKAAPEPTTTAS
jgi:hypothetical protein